MNDPATALARRLATRIAREGPISLASYMAEVLTQPEQGYYSRQDPFGAAGDFITAPEISQMFGELIGLWCVDCWQRFGAPERVLLVELGPGRGSLMADALRAAALVSDFCAAIELHLVEASPTLRALQRERLSQHAVTWHDNLGQVPEGPLILIANEFFDALPIRQFVRTETGWAERLVGLARPWHQEQASEPAFTFVLATPNQVAQHLLPAGTTTAAMGGLAEICPAGVSLASEIGRRLRCHGGCALVIDYGYTDGQTRASLQALRRHQPHVVLEAPGTADLTAHVDFEALSGAAAKAGAQVFGPVDQAGFLNALGIQERAARLKAAASPRQAQDIDSGLQRLTASDQMGTLFKVLGLAGPDITELAGF